MKTKWPHWHLRMRLPPTELSNTVNSGTTAPGLPPRATHENMRRLARARRATARAPTPTRPRAIAAGPTRTRFAP